MNTYKVEVVNGVVPYIVTADKAERSGTSVDFYVKEELVASIPLDKLVIFHKE